MNEKNPNEYRDNLAEKLKGARKIDKDMAQQFLEKSQGTKEYQDARNEKISAFQESKTENNFENLEKEIAQESTVLSRRQENISNLNTELGGEEGIKEVIDKMPPEEKTKLEQKIEAKRAGIEKTLKAMTGGIGAEGGELSTLGSLEMMWESLKLPFSYEDTDGVPKILMAPTGIVFGGVLLGPGMVADVVRGIKLIKDKIQLKFLKGKTS